MKRLAVVVLASLLLPWPGHAVTMDEAVSLALANNHRVKDFRQRTEAQRKRVDSGKAPFWPEVEATYGYERAENTFSFQTRDASTFTAEIRYNLFRGFSDQSALGAARSTLAAARHEQKAAEADVVLEVKRAFIDLLRARKGLEVARESVELLARQSRDAELFYRGGLTAKNEFLKVEVELASARQDLLKAESAFRVARKGLERVTGVPVGEEEPIGETAFGEPAGLDEGALAPLMMERRSELRFLAALRQARERARDSIRGGYLPSVDLSLSHSRFGEAFAFEGREDPLFDSDTNAAVEAKWTLFDGFRKRSDILAESAEIRAVEERIRDTQDDLLLQLKSAVEGYRVSAGRITLARKSVEQAEENYRITQSQFRERVATTTDLLDARVFLARARTEYNNAFYDLGLSLATLERVVEGPVATGPVGGEARGN